MRRTAFRTLAGALVASVLVVSMTGCGGDEAGGPAAPVDPEPGLITAMQPPPRSQAVGVDAAIWCESAQPLDPATVNATTVFLKQDTRRLTVAVAYEAATRRIRVYPAAPLSLRKTYTVELSSAIRTSSGGALSGGYWWQFTTTTVRIPHSPQPMNGATGESPFVLLQWKGLTESSAGTIQYELRAGPDSVTATDPATAPLAVVHTGRWLPLSRWSQDAGNWWSVRARNLSTGESVSGLAWRFDCLPASTPSETLDVPLRDYSYFTVSQNLNRCFADSVVSGNLFTAYYRYRFPALDTTWRVASALFEVSPLPHWQAYVAAGVSVWAANADWAECTSGAPGPPFVDDTGKLADGEILRPSRVRFTTGALTAHTEAMIRFGGYYGYVLRSSNRVGWYPGLGYSDEVRGRLRIVVYRPTASAAHRVR